MLLLGFTPHRRHARFLSSFSRAPSSAFLLTALMAEVEAPTQEVKLFGRWSFEDVQVPHHFHPSTFSLTHPRLIVLSLMLRRFGF